VTTVVVLQPAFCHGSDSSIRCFRSDVFVYYDDVQFDKHGWRNRNRIKSASGPAWITIPVLHSRKHGQRIMDAEIDNQQKLGAQRARGDSPELCARDLCRRLSSRARGRADEVLAISCGTSIFAIVEHDVPMLSFQRPLFRSSELGVEGDKSGRLLAICQHFSASKYLSGNAAQDYLDPSFSRDAGIGVEWPEFHSSYISAAPWRFHPYLSALTWC